jgi:hypothetical protein
MGEGGKYAQGYDGGNQNNYHHPIHFQPVSFPPLLFHIDLPKGITDRLNPIAMKIGEQFQLYGIRAKINFRCLLKCLQGISGIGRLHEFQIQSDIMATK